MKQPYVLVRARPEPEFEISVDGIPVPVIPGQTIGAALHGAGIRSWRATRFGGRPRGLFCGIGVCFDCLVTVNDSPSLRACLVEARPGDRVSTRTETGPGEPAVQDPAARNPAAPDPAARDGQGGRDQDERRRDGQGTVNGR
ncbi:(2Fe-2S)-binding protein [Streptosporangium sp. CA-135522]|uniref:(2Fe-2S)-binding protein n=1 Tax=Streptosporangium sp. CA-135522 TaxID=3240072 RepID=UPI003D8D8A88